MIPMVRRACARIDTANRPFADGLRLANFFMMISDQGLVTADAANDVIASGGHDRSENADRTRIPWEA